MAEGLIISGARKRTREEMFARSNRVATGFDAIGVGLGDSVALMLRNDFTFLEATFARTVRVWWSLLRRTTLATAVVAGGALIFSSIRLSQEIF